MSRSSFDVQLNADGTGTVLLNGHEVPGLQAIRVEGARNVTPLVTLQLAADVHVEGVGELSAAATPSPDAVAELDAILADIDPDTIDRSILESAGLGDTGGGAREYLAAIRRFVRGD